MLCLILYLREVSKYKPQGGAYILMGDLTEGLLRYDFGGAYTRRTMFSKFSGIFTTSQIMALCVFASTEQVSNPLTPGVTSFSLHMKVRRLPCMCKRVRNAREHCVPPVTAGELFICLSSFFIFSASKRSLNILLVRSTLFLTLKTTFRASLKTFLKCF